MRGRSGGEQPGPHAETRGKVETSGKADPCGQVRGYATNVRSVDATHEYTIHRFSTRCCGSLRMPQSVRDCEQCCLVGSFIHTFHTIPPPLKQHSAVESTCVITTTCAREHSVAPCDALTLQRQPAWLHCCCCTSKSSTASRSCPSPTRSRSDQISRLHQIRARLAHEGMVARSVRSRAPFQCFKIQSPAHTWRRGVARESAGAHRELDAQRETKSIHLRIAEAAERLHGELRIPASRVR